MAILGLIGTEQFYNQRTRNYRRRVFYQYPNGSAPLTGLLSLMGEETTNDPEFSWWEKRMAEQWSTTVDVSTTVQFTSWNGTTLGTAAATGNITFAPGERTGIEVADASQFRVGHIAMANFFYLTSGLQEGKFEVEAVDQTNNVLGIKCLQGHATNDLDYDYDYDTNSVDRQVLIIGSAHAQGAVGAATSPYTLPIQPENYCQIFRTPFQITGSALKTSAKYDETGPYKDQAKEVSINHMIEMEKAFMFGVKSVGFGTTIDPSRPSSSTTLPTYTTGGIIYHLEQWETGTPYGVTAATTNAHDNKRIINIADESGSNVTLDEFEVFLERVFRTTNNKANEKLCLCGNGFLRQVQLMYKNTVTMNVNVPYKEAYGMAVVKHVTPFGTLYYKTHPLFNQNSSLRSNGLIVDPGFLKYRYMAGRDTELLTERQARNADYREDEWFTDAGLEVRFPEAHMYIKNLVFG